MVKRHIIHPLHLALRKGILLRGGLPSWRGVFQREGESSMYFSESFGCSLNSQSSRLLVQRYGSRVHPLFPEACGFLNYPRYLEVIRGLQVISRDALEIIQC